MADWWKNKSKKPESQEPATSNQESGSRIKKNIKKSHS